MSPTNHISLCVAQSGRVLALEARGRRFKSYHADQIQMRYNARIPVRLRHYTNSPVATLPVRVIRQLNGVGKPGKKVESLLLN